MAKLAGARVAQEEKKNVEITKSGNFLNSSEGSYAARAKRPAKARGLARQRRTYARRSIIIKPGHLFAPASEGDC